MIEIDPEVKELLERARPARPAPPDWEDVLRRSRRGRRRLFGVPMRGALLAAAVLIGLGAAAQAETGVFQFITDHHANPKAATDARVRKGLAEARDIDIVSSLPHGAAGAVSTVGAASAARMAATFGGPASRYPPRADVIVVHGPISIPLYLQGCATMPYVCPAPVGSWAWLAYAVLPSARTGPMARLPNVRLLRAAPPGTPFPALGRLGQVTVDHIPARDHETIVREHQGSIAVVARDGAALTEARVTCMYARQGYTLPTCAALARYVAFLRQPHPDETPPASGDWTRVSGTIGGWRGNLVITAASLAHAPAALRSRVTTGLAAVHGTRISRVPPGIDCVVNPIPCYRSIPTRIHKIVEAVNRHGLDEAVIPLAQIPPSYRRAIPATLTIDGAASNAGDPAAVKQRGAVFSMTFDHVAPDSLRQTFVKLLGRNWGVFVDENSVTLYHPFYFPKPPNTAHLKGAALRRAFARYQAEYSRDERRDKVGYAILRGLDRLMTTR